MIENQDKAKPYLSIVSPVYRAEKIVDELVKRIVEEVSKITSNFEIVLVEDGSPDKSWDKIEENCLKEKRVKGVKLSRNFGQHYAITAGLAHAKGDYTVLMDCDLQDNPKYIWDLHQKAMEGFDIVYTFKAQRKHSIFKNFTAFLFGKLFNYLIGNKSVVYNSNVGAFSMLSRKAVNAFLSINDYQRHYLMILRWIGFHHTYVQIEHEERYEGKSSYNFSKLLNHAINGIISQSEKVMKLFIYVGLLIALIAFIGILAVIILYFLHGFLSGWASLFVTLLFSLSIILISLGIVGLYVEKTLEQSKNRPKYLIDKILNNYD